MRLNCALVSSLLFLSPVLAEDSLMGGARFDPINRRNPHSDKPKTDGASGSFTVPNDIRGDQGSGFTISIGLDLGCPTATVSVGVTVYMVARNEPWIGAWFAFGPPHNERWVSCPYDILPGDELAIKVWLPLPSPPNEPRNMKAEMELHVTRTGGEPRLWFGTVLSIPGYPLCEDNAFWIVGSVYNADRTSVLPLPDFDEVVFEDIKMLDLDGNAILSGSHVVTYLYLKQDDELKTSVRVYDVGSARQKAEIHVRFLK